MFGHADIKGFDLPNKTLCLTYDDGPGPQTAELSECLARERISATFFVIGRHAEQHPATLKSLARGGHTIGNHTYSHPGLVRLAESGGDVVGELARTDEIIRPFAEGQPIFFRAPYGNWRQIDPTTGRDREVSVVADRLNRADGFARYLGPVNWDISAEDFSFWRRGAGALEAAEAYLAAIDQAGRGIVLLHDSSDDEQICNNNRTLEFTMLLVPELRRRGYRFVPLAELPQVQALRRKFRRARTRAACRKQPR
jgi:peptidoglycan/xylan/chitin deacetylase (PgdA/CDA1 family)